MHTVFDYLNDLTLRAYVRLQVFALDEPVRLRAALTSAIMVLAFAFPSITASVAERVAYVGAAVLPILVGESARSKVTPTDPADEE
ncbi:hypothetical protein SPW_7321 [Streptomyces sp. W007]|uniref:hypothetical protein n=1 Tax=Streptomyces sp. W007 TaxID=1055352 RepID=UPI000241A5A5|nr:hypothetical protein [Streptomyces sp. W007]EHM24227.1 hypothetical protein SPW_7321 [Streptomyces sp. W007]